MAVNARKVTFDFTDPAALGVAAPAAGAVTVLTDSVLVKDGVNLSFTSGSTPTRIWNSNGNYTLRVYKNGGSLKFEAAEDITGVEFTGSTIDFNEFEGNAWIAETPAKSVTFTAKTNSTISSVTLTIGEEAVVWVPDTVSVTEANALVANKDIHDHYVYGVLMNAPFNVYSVFSGTVSFWLSDTENPTDSIEFFQGGAEENAKWESLMQAQELLHKGDTVLVYAGSLMAYGRAENDTITEITGGYYAEMIAPNPDPEEVEYPKLRVADAIAVAEALEPERGKSKSTTEIYAVYGYAKVKNAEKKTYYLTDEAGELGVFQAYQCAEIDDVVNDGDFVKVIGLITHYYGNSETIGEYHTYEISGGYLYHVDPPYTITTYASPEIAGSVQKQGSTLTAIPNEGYHFVCWQDSITVNPRTIELTQDTIFTAYFAPNICSFNVTCDTMMGSVDAVNGEYTYQTILTVTATPKDGYRFIQWSDGNTSASRNIVITHNIELIAYFEPITYTISAANNPQGSVSGTGQYPYLSECVVTAIPHDGYHFVQWLDGETANPRTIIVTQDYILGAIFDIDTTGTCGKNLALTWAYNSSTTTLTISGSGSFDENMECGVEAKQNMTRLVIDEGVTAIGANAFANSTNLTEVQLPASIKTIGAKAFENCLDMMSIYNYRERPCLLDASAFDGVNTFDCTLYVLAGSVNMYQAAASNWSIFYFIEPIGSTVISDQITDVETEPADNNVEVTWPITEGAESYTLEIRKDGVVFCTLIFNANGQLLGISFAPGREGNNAPMAIHTENGGLRFTVTGLQSGTDYQLTVTAKDANEEIVETYSSNFTTTGSASSPTGFDNIGSDNQLTKILRNGQILILRGEKAYTITGTEVR